MSAESDRPTESADGSFTFKNLPLERVTLGLGPREFVLFGLRDAAELLDDARFARRFEELDLAPYGLQLWPASVMLAEYLPRLAPANGAAALELGCGIGLVSAAATCMGWCVTATDEDPAALELARFNAQRNGIDVGTFLPLDWRRPALRQRFPLILGADLLYESRNHDPVMRCIRTMLERGGLALIADPNRTIADDFASVARAGGFVVQTHAVTTSALARPHDGRVFELRHA